MATAIFLNLPAHGHVNPTIPLVSELVQRGERIIYYASEQFRAKLEKTGAEFRSYGDEYKFDPNQDLGGPLGLMARAIEVTETLLPTLMGHFQTDKPDYLILDSMCVWGNLAQQLLKVPAVTSCTTFAFSPQMYQSIPWSQRPLKPLLLGVPSFLRYLQVARRIDRRYGTRSPGMGDFFVNRQALNLVFTSREFQPFADSFDPSYKFVGSSLAPPSGAGSDFPFDKLGSQPLIYISMGTIFNQVADFYRACFQAFAGKPYQVVMSIGIKLDPALLGTPPANFIVRPFVPQLEILQRATLFITHGGMNSVNESLFYQVPMLVLPQMGDQHFVAARIHELQLGLHLDPAKATAQALAHHADRIMADPAFKARCAAMGQTLQSAGGATRAADEILKFQQRSALAV